MLSPRELRSGLPHVFLSNGIPRGRRIWHHAGHGSRFLLCQIEGPLSKRLPAAACTAAVAAAITAPAAAAAIEAHADVPRRIPR